MKIKLFRKSTARVGVQVLIGVLILAVVVLAAALYHRSISSSGTTDRRPEAGDIPAQSGPTASDFKQLQDSMAQAFQGQQQAAKDFGNSIQLLVATNNALQQQLKDNTAASEALKRENEYLNNVVTNLTADVGALSNRLATTLLTPPPTGGASPTAPNDSGNPPPPPGPENNNLGNIANVVAAGLCLIKPPVCAAAQLIAKILGGLGSQESLRTFEKIVKGLKVSPDEIKHLTDELSKAGVPVTNLIQVREALESISAVSSNPQVTTLLNSIKNIMATKLAAGVGPLMDAIRANPPKSSSDLEKLLKDQFVAGFPSEEVRQEVVEALKSFGAATGADVNWMIEQVSQFNH